VPQRDAGEALGGGEGRSRIDHGHVDAGERGEVDQGLAEVHGPDDHQPQGSRENLHEEAAARHLQ
jgi:hypothetical protein